MAHQSPSLAGRPPYATDENEIYSTQPTPQRRIRQNPGPDPNNRTSAYNMYDQYLDDSKRQSGAGALGMGFMNGDLDSEDEDDDSNDHHQPHSGHNKHTALAAALQPQSQATIPLASPRPGYAAPIAALNLSRPSPEASPQIQMPQAQPQMAQLPSALLPAGLRAGGGNGLPAALSSGRGPAPPPLNLPHSDPFGSPRGGMPSPLGSPRGAPPRPSFGSSPSPTVPSTPHPLEAPITPITPVFLRPAKASAAENVTFASEAIIRGNSEDNLIPKRGEKGDDFWRRFSMVAKEETARGEKESTWLRKTQNGTTRLSRWVWIIGVVLILCIGGAIGIGWYFTHNNPGHQQPEVFGGSENESASSAPASSSAKHSGTAPHVSPTNTVARRDAFPEPAPTTVPIHLVHVAQPRFGSEPFGAVPLAALPKRLSRHANRTHRH